MSIFEKQLEVSNDPQVLTLVRRLNDFDKICFKKCIDTPEKRLYEEDEKCLSNK
jgi:Tim10/DDP family zinc finger.